MANTIETIGEHHVRMDLNLNGEPVSHVVNGGRRLIDFLRDDLHLYGTKEGCGEGECGSCTVLLNGTATLACLTPMERASGGEVQTIEGIGTAENLPPLQWAMMEEAGVQCGICTPGFIVAAKALLDIEPDPSEHRIRFWLANNLCRCTGYQKIITAIQRAAMTTA